MNRLKIYCALIALFLLVACAGETDEPAVQPEGIPTIANTAVPAVETIPEDTDVAESIPEDNNEPENTASEKVVSSIESNGDTAVGYDFAPWTGPKIPASQATQETPAPLGTSVSFANGMDITFVKVIRPATDYLIGLSDLDLMWHDVLRNELAENKESIAIEVVVTCPNTIETCPAYFANQLVETRQPLVTLDGRDSSLVPLLNQADWPVGETRHGVLFATGIARKTVVSNVEVGVRSNVDFNSEYAYLSLNDESG